MVLVFLLGKVSSVGQLLSFLFLLKNSVKLYYWHYTVEQTSTMNREAGSWKPIIILFSTPRGREAPESFRETFQHCTSGELTAVARICFYGNRRLNSSSVLRICRGKLQDKLLELSSFSRGLIYSLLDGCPTQQPRATCGYLNDNYSKFSF